jgi:glycosyltransferase involved in cell wall biosynthesis
VKISVVIPVLDAHDELARCLDAIESQQVDGDVEVVVVDSGSTDGSVEFARQRGAVVLEIPKRRFSFGRSRNLGAEAASGEVLVFTSADAFAADERWLATLVAPLAGDEAVAGVYGRQVPQDHAMPSEEYFLRFVYGPEPRDQFINGSHELTMETTLFSNANSAMPREIWSRYRFDEEIVGSEDLEWAVRALLDGYHLRYEPAAAVRHSHDFTLGGAFRRFFDLGVASGRAYMAGGRRSRWVLIRNAVDYSCGEMVWLVRSGRARAVPYAIVYEVTKFTALQIGHHHRLLPLSLKRRFSVFPDQWF